MVEDGYQSEVDILSKNISEFYQEFIYKRTYSRWIDEENRRETWEETVNRYCDFMSNKVPNSKKAEFRKACEAIQKKEVMPSMRGLWTAGKALERESLCLYNCSYIVVDHPRVFAETLYVLMNGVGVGFSIERQYVNKMPPIPETLTNSDIVITFADSKLGWAKGFNEIIKCIYDGKIPKYDLSKIRPAGERLKIFGGKACLTGDTVVYKDRKKSQEYNEITIEELYNMKTSGKCKTKSSATRPGPSHFNKIKLRSLNEETGEFYRNKLIDVIYNGEHQVYEIITKNGYKIKATDNHRFMNAAGNWQYLSEFKIDDDIAVNGSETKSCNCVDCNKPISRRALRCVDCYNIYQQKNDCLETTARQRKECRNALVSKCEECERSDIRLEIHHKDKNVYNNDPSNLITLCVNCHQHLHAIDNTFGKPYSHKYISYDKIISITPCGVEKVYDLSMEAPDHNFIANGFISHNSGPGPLKELIDFSFNMFKKAAGRKLTSIECHDLMCMIASVIIVGGVRRCLKYNTTVLMADNTYKQIKDILPGEFILFDNQQVEVKNNFDNGIQETIEIELDTGETIKCTPEHRWFVYNHDTDESLWIQTKDLESGNYSFISPE